MFRQSIALFKLSVFIYLAFMVLMNAAMAGTPEEIKWEQLEPDTPGFDDPFLKLTDDQIMNLSIVAEIRDIVATGEELPDESIEEEKALTQLLISEDIDVDGLLARRDEITQKREAAGKVTNTAMAGKLVRIPGYLLPLSFNDELAIEFLLVPYVGACIHVPPPPPNQIIYVTYKTGYKSEGLYAPIWVTGQLQIEQSEPELFLGDGSEKIPVGYRLQADIVEPYEIQD